MGTKNKPGEFDCYKNAEPDEPMFVLLGRDPTASMVVAFWRILKMEMVKQGTSKSSQEKLEEAHVCSIALADWARLKGKNLTGASIAMRAAFTTLFGPRLGTKTEMIQFHLCEAAKLMEEANDAEIARNLQITTEPSNERMNDLVGSMACAAVEAFVHRGDRW